MEQKELDLEEQAEEILEKAKAKGVEQSYMFVTTFERYRNHIRHLKDLEDAIQSEGTTVTKEYVKGRANLYVNPAIAAYNQTANSADKAAALLLKYIDLMNDGSGESGDEFDNF